MRQYQFILYSLCAVVMGGLYACEEDTPDALPGDGQVAYVNFVNAAEVFLYGGNESLHWGNHVFINDTLDNFPFDNFTGKYGNSPFAFQTEASSEYVPRVPLGLTSLSGGAVLDIAYSDLTWLAVASGTYKIIYTSKNKTYLKTADVAVATQTYNVVYLTESPETDSSYAVIHAPIVQGDRKEGFVRVQLVNLATDAGEVEAYRVDVAGNEIASDLPSVPFGEFADAELPIAGTEETFNRILINFRKRESSEVILSVSVPAESGAVYTLLLRGFINETVRKVKTDNQTSAWVTVLPDLRCSVSRVFY